MAMSSIYGLRSTARRSRLSCGHRRLRSPVILPVVLLTSEFNEELLPGDQLKEIYSSRWEFEVYYRSLKQTWGCSQLLSRTPGDCLNEERWRLLSQ